MSDEVHNIKEPATQTTNWDVLILVLHFWINIVSRTSLMEALLVGDYPCSFDAVCEVLSNSKAAGVLWRNLIQLARSLGYPADKVSLITPWLHNEIKTHYDILYEILETWRAKESNKAKLQALLNVLESKNLHDCADALRLRFWSAHDL